MSDEWLTTAQAAEYLAARGVVVEWVRHKDRPPQPPKPGTVQHWCKRGLLPAENIGNRVWRIKRSDLDAFTPPVHGRAIRKGQDSGHHDA